MFGLRANVKSGLHKVKSNTPGLGGLFIIYQGSALTEYEGQRGLHHLAEHLQCASYKHLEEELQACGIISNAYTAEDHVAYYWTGLDRKIEQYQKELLELVKYIPTREQFEMEKNIVLQEYRDHTSSQGFVFSNIQRKYFNYFGPIGYYKDIEEITFKEFIDFYVRAFMRPTSIIRIGDSNTIDKDTKEFQYFSDRPTLDINLVQNPTDECVESNSSFPDTKNIFDWIPIDGEISYKNLIIISQMLSSGLTSPLYQELREKRGLVYGLGLYVHFFNSSVGLVTFNAACAPDKDVELREVLMATMSEESITRERFETIIESLKCRKEMELILNYDSITEFVAYDWEMIDMNYLNTITFEEIKEDGKKFVSMFKNCRHASQSKETEL